MMSGDGTNQMSSHGIQPNVGWWLTGKCTLDAVHSRRRSGSSSSSDIGGCEISMLIYRRTQFAHGGVIDGWYVLIITRAFSGCQLKCAGVHPSIHSHLQSLGQVKESCILFSVGE